ncbi:MAG: LysE family transporter [Nitrospirae bacterium]|nr:LysE family transporter [Nitrospirota bacterium]
MKIFRSGLSTGLLLQLAIGPVFFFVVNLTIQKTVLDGFVAVLAVTIVDYIYITLAILGVGKLLENKKIKKIFGIISSAVLIIFGWIIIKGVIESGITTSANAISSNLFASFTSVFVLTISSPLTIVFFTSLFATKAVELNYTKPELLIFGLSTGSATFIFLGASVILFSIIGGAIPAMVIKLLNIFVGLVLIGYGIVRIVKAIQNSESHENKNGKWGQSQPDNLRK